MFQIGESLREARTRRGFTSADVHKAIRIRERYLTALEEERWDMLPGDTYTKGFLRTYAEYLGLNSQLYLDEYNARVARHEDDAPLLVAHPSVERKRRLGRGIVGALIAIVVVAAVAGLAAWRLGGSSSPPRSSSGPPATVTSSHQSTTTHATKRKAVVPAAPVLTSIVATRGDCWLLVRKGGPDGAIVFEGTLQQGQSKQFRFTSRLWMRMGRPDALDVTLAGKPLTNLPASPANVLLTRAGAIPA
jgi:cytoskeleton protein RodZ